MSKLSFAWLTSCILFGSVALSTASFSRMAQAQSVQLQLDGPESTVARFHQAIQDRDFNSLSRYYCSAERTAVQQANSRLDSDGQRMALLNAYLQISSNIYSIDVSQLYYETKYYDAQLGRAVVAITGDVIVRSPNGQTLAIPYRRFSAFGRDWLRLINENNEWKLCYNLTR